jgi:hypothetical protein
MRTQEEILKRIEQRTQDDFFGFEVPCYIAFLEYEHAKPYLMDDITQDQWNTMKKTDPRKEMIDYMAFAWDKANNCRGISANRSINHYVAWLWLDGQTEMADTLGDGYEFYGKPVLEKICKYLGLDSSKWDDGIRTNDDY